MNKYSIDENYRIYIYFSLAFISISLSPYIAFIEKIFDFRFPVTPFMIFFGLNWVFNNYLWSLQCVSKEKGSSLLLAFIGLF